jgi:UDP-N-acetylmuramate dehydrogenase
MQIFENISLKKYNTFKVDVASRFLWEASNANEIIENLSKDEYSKLPIFILGEGSNVLFTKDFPGIIIHIVSKGIKIVEENEAIAVVEAEAGEIWDDVVKYCVENNLYGVENLALIPGTIGAAPVQNIGAYGVEFQDVCQSVTGLTLPKGREKVLLKSECKFDYRDSVFKKELKTNFLITNVRICLSKSKKFNLNYRAFQEQLKSIDTNKLTLKDVSALVRRIRQSKLPDQEKIGSAGSFFKNPEVNARKFGELKKSFNDLVFFRLENGSYKIPAGWLIEKCGYKGKIAGNVGTYKHQALVIINRGKASGEEVQHFALKIQKDVFEKFGIEILPEVNIL